MTDRAVSPTILAAALVVLAAAVIVCLLALTERREGTCGSIVDDFGQPLTCEPVTVNSAPACKCSIAGEVWP